MTASERPVGQPAPPSAAVADGLLMVDKPPGWTSHDVVARVRRLAGTRRVGHAGTLDPMATGVLVLGIGRGTRLLGHLALTDKGYLATIRLGASTTTDDAEGELIESRDASAIGAADVGRGVAALTGSIEQVPSSVSAIKVDGKRAYKRVRAGEAVELAARPVTIDRFDVLALQRQDGVVDLDVHVECSTGTYVRALARDLGVSLGVGGHLTALRRTRVGPYAIDAARTLDELAREFSTMSLGEAAAASFRSRTVDAPAAEELANGRPVPLAGSDPGDDLLAVLSEAGDLVALVRADQAAGTLRPAAVFASPSGAPRAAPAG